ncbi:MAG: TlpA family protein disulfide reductase [bacterium]
MNITVRIILVTTIIAVSIAGWQTIQFSSPDVRYQIIDGTKILQSELKGKVTLINFWSATCPPCVEEMPDLQQLHEQYPDKLAIVGVIMHYDRPDAAIGLARKIGVTYPIALDIEGEIAAAFDIEAIPTSILINPDGNIQRVRVGKVDPTRLTQEIISLTE